MTSRKIVLTTFCGAIAGLAFASVAWACTLLPMKGTPWLCPSSNPTCGWNAFPSFSSTDTVYTGAYDLAETGSVGVPRILKAAPATGNGTIDDQTCHQGYVMGIFTPDVDTNGNGNPDGWSGEGPVDLPPLPNDYSLCAVVDGTAAISSHHNIFSII